MPREGDNRIAIMAGFIFMLVLAWFPPLGIIIAGFLIGFISARPREGAIVAAILAAIGALIQVIFITRVLPFVGLSIAIVGLGALSISGLLTALFGPLSQVFLGVSDLLASSAEAQMMVLLSLYALLGALGGFVGGLVKQ